MALWGERDGEFATNTHVVRKRKEGRKRPKHMLWLNQRYFIRCIIIKDFFFRHWILLYPQHHQCISLLPDKSKWLDHSMSEQSQFISPSMPLTTLLPACKSASIDGSLLLPSTGLMNIVAKCVHHLRYAAHLHSPHSPANILTNEELPHALQFPVFYAFILLPLKTVVNHKTHHHSLSLQLQLSSSFKELQKKYWNVSIR